MVDYALRPVELDGCWGSWSESDMATVVRTDMESGTPKVRRRFTGVHRIAQVSVTVDKAKLPDFMTWFRVSCQAGVRPTAIREPDGTEAVWRFTAPLTIDWEAPGTNAVRISAQIERLPGWQAL